MSKYKIGDKVNVKDVNQTAEITQVFNGWYGVEDYMIVASIDKYKILQDRTSAFQVVFNLRRNLNTDSYLDKMSNEQINAVYYKVIVPNSDDMIVPEFHIIEDSRVKETKNEEPGIIQSSPQQNKDL